MLSLKDFKSVKIKNEKGQKLDKISGGAYPGYGDKHDALTWSVPHGPSGHTLAEDGSNAGNLITYD